MSVVMNLRYDRSQARWNTAIATSASPRARSMMPIRSFARRGIIPDAASAGGDDMDVDDTGEDLVSVMACQYQPAGKRTTDLGAGLLEI